MIERMRERWNLWGERLSFGALLLVFSEWVVWQTPTQFSPLEWIGVAAVVLALAAVALDLIARLNVSDVFSLFLLAGLYGLADATLISHITARDLPLSLIVRPLSAQPLAFMAALAAFQILAGGRATGPLDFAAALGIGLAWGVWVRWFPVVSDEPIPAVAIGTALAALAIGLMACAALRFALPPAAIGRREDWLLGPLEWALAGGVLVAALALGVARDAISGAALAILIGLGGFLVVMLVATRGLRRGASLLARVTPPRRPNPAAWAAVMVPFLVAGWIGYSLPGSGASAVQSDLLFGALTGFGIVWPPAVSALLGIRAFAQLAREGM